MKYIRNIFHGRTLFLSNKIFQTTTQTVKIQQYRLNVVGDDLFQVEELETLVQGLWLRIGCLHLLRMPLFKFHMSVWYTCVYCYTKC